MLAWFACVCFAPSAETAEVAAEVVMVLGTAEHSEDSEASWNRAAVGNQLAFGSVIRTLANSQAGLLFPGASTQRRLAQNSKLLIKPAEAAARANAAAVRMMKGKMWSNARPRTAPADGEEPDLGVETPTATLAIRGTDWIVEVADDGSTRLAVLSGVVDIGNTMGSLSIGAGEAALVKPGAAPVRMTLVDPKSRVQWISSWRPRPRYWAGDDATRFPEVLRQIETGEFEAALMAVIPPAATDVTAALLAADLQIHLGELGTATNLLEVYAHQGLGDPRATALLAQALARADRLPDAELALDTALASHPEDTALLLARGDIAVLQGDAPTATRHYAEAAGLDPASAEAWYGQGLVAAEREEVRRARSLLDRALELDPAFSRAAAERAAVDTFAGNLDRAGERYDAVLRAAPEDYVALTGRGINKLKAGDAGAALDDFLRAGVIESGYARAWLYQGVAFYQLHDRKRAVEAFEHAASLDANDPLPHLLLSVLETDRLDYPAAIAAAREAEHRMPYLKSLNQVANDQKGNANLGTGLAEFGLEQWATHYAYEAYSPYWAGSHLFLADRYTGEFTKNSELFKGFITDPSVFGASNRESTLVARPGHYAEVSANAEHTDDEWDQLTASATANGMIVGPMPLAYFVSGKAIETEAANADSELDADGITIGLGARPRHDLGVFGFFTDSGIDGTLRTSLVPDDPFDFEDTRGDVGINYKWGPRHQFWLKGGRNEQRTHLYGDLYSEALADVFNEAVGRELFSPDGELEAFRSSIDQDELQFRHAFDAAGITWSWGAEGADKQREGLLAAIFHPLRLRIAEQAELESRDAHAGAGFGTGGVLQWQAELHYQQHDYSRSQLDAFDVLITQPPTEIVVGDRAQARGYDELNPRFGVAWRPRDGETLRLVAQRWRRPASAATLGAVDTLGVALNDMLPAEGGKYERIRFQYETEASSRLFVQAFADHEQVANGLAGQDSAVADFDLRTLKDLLNQPDVFAPLEDFEATPEFGAGEVSTLGVATNWLVGAHASTSLRYLYRDSEQHDVSVDRPIPLIPEHYLEWRGNLSLPGRWLLGAHAIWRDERYRNWDYREPIDAGWSFGATGYWETGDKRASVHVVVENLLPEEDAGLHPDTRAMIKGTYRF